MSKVCLIMAGGTGGHVFPGLAVADELVKKGWHIEWLGTAERMEADVVPAHGYPIHFVPVKGIRGKGISAKLTGILGLFKALWIAYRTVKKVNPDIVIGMGGYASGPGGIAAWLLRRPVVLHEQNAAAGLTNRLLGRVASKILLGFEQAEKAFAYKPQACVYVGNPVRKDISELPLKSNVAQPLNLLVLGGSLGAQALNEAVPTACVGNQGLNIWHQCGRGNKADVEHRYQSFSGKWDVTEFIDDMAQAYQWADLIVCRAGALTVAEVAAAGVAAVFVPLPHAVDDHQTKNALTLVDAGAAKVIKQNELKETLEETLREFIQQPSLCLEMGQNGKKSALINATQQVVVQCESLIGVAA